MTMRNGRNDFMYVNDEQVSIWIELEVVVQCMLYS